LVGQGELASRLDQEKVMCGSKSLKWVNAPPCLVYLSSAFSVMWSLRSSPMPLIWFDLGLWSA